MESTNQSIFKPVKTFELFAQNEDSIRATVTELKNDMKSSLFVDLRAWFDERPLRFGVFLKTNEFVKVARHLRDKKNWCNSRPRVEKA